MRNLEFCRGLTAVIVTPILLLISAGAASQGNSPAGVGLPPRPTVISVTVTDSSTSPIVDIVGTDFDSPNGALVEVTLGGVPLTVDIGTLTGQFISASSEFAFAPGDYSLVVVTTVGGVGYDLTVGAVGSRGAQGIQGIQGEQGDPGPSGADGVDGVDGMTGADGQDGTSCSVDQGTGSATVNCTDGTNATVFDGAVGDIGPQGNVGPEGPAGPPGNPGADGADGAAGAQGPQGETGPQGPQGEQGEQGEQGLTGGPGPAGPPGGTTGSTPACNSQVFLSSGRLVDDGQWSCFGGGGVSVRLADECSLQSKPTTTCHEGVFVDDIILIGPIVNFESGKEIDPISDLQFDAGLSDFSLRSLSISPLEFEVKQSGNQFFSPGAPSPVTIFIQGIVKQEADTDAADWFQKNTEAFDDIRNMTVSLLDSNGFSPVVSYTFGSCVPLSYQSMPLGLEFVESLQIHCAIMTDFQHEFRPALAAWIMALIDGTPPLQDTLTVMFLDNDLNSVQTQIYSDVFPISYRFPLFVFPFGGLSTSQEVVFIKANGRMTQ